MIKLITDNNELRNMAKDGLISRSITSHHVNMGQYPITHSYVESKNKEVITNIINWSDNNHYDIELFYSKALDSISMQIIICWFIKFPTKESLVHYQLSDVKLGEIEFDD